MPITNPFEDNNCNVFFYIMPAYDNSVSNIIYNFGVHKNIIEVYNR